ncbi:MAG: right-handed parallel beta-helix repeat-containing protein [Phycisphaerales bacterium]
MKYAHTRLSRIAPVAIAALIVSAGALIAGPLNPPTGPIASTMKTMTEVEPRIAINATNTPGDADSMFKITSPGSYYLTSQVTVLPNKLGIEVAADGVTIDLNGYRVAGFAGSLDGIRTTGALRSDITIKNGTVGPISGDGVSLGAGGDVARACRIEKVNAVDCGNMGLRVDTEALVSGCLVSGCGSTGVYIGNSARVVDCMVSRCSDGILASNGATIERCTVELCNGDGILVGGTSRIVDNTCNDNGVQSAAGAGIHVFGAGGHETVIRGNHCSNNDRGIWAEGTASVIIGNTCPNNPLVIGPDNYYGPVINRINPGTPGMNGYSAPSTLGTTDPNANITY